MGKQLKLNFLSLERERNEKMTEFRSMIDEERALAVKLGLEAVDVDEDTIPSQEDISRVENNLRRLVKVKDEREIQVFTMKEKIITLMDKLGMDMNATTLSLVLDGDDRLDSLKPDDLRSVQHTMDELTKSVEEREVEVNELRKDINNMYTRLNVQPADHCPLATGRVCGLEDLIKEDYIHQLREEKLKLDQIKRVNMRIIIDNAKSELSTLWEECMVGEDEQAVFLNSLDEDDDSALIAIEAEIRRLQEYHNQYKDIFQKLSAYVDLSFLAEDLKERMQDPNRLFRNRGKTLMKEEQDRKKVQTFPKRKDELLALAESRGNLIIYDEMISEYVENLYQNYLELFQPAGSTGKYKQSSSLSSTRIGRGSSTPMLSNKTASPRSIKAGGKYDKSPARMVGSRTLQTPQSLQYSVRGNKTASPKSTKKIGKSYKSPALKVGAKSLRRPQTSHRSVRDVTTNNSSPRARPSKRMTRSNTLLLTSQIDACRTIQIPDMIIDDAIVNERAFSQNVPCNSTVCMNTTTNRRDDTTTDPDNTVVLSGIMNQLVAVRDAAVQQDRTLQQQKETFGRKRGTDARAGVGTCKQFGQDFAKAQRKLRRSNSCSDIALFSKKQGGQRNRLASGSNSKENLPSIREYSGQDRPPMVRSKTNLSATGFKNGKSGTGKLSRTGSSSKILLR